MPSRNDDLNRLRADVLKAQARAGRKIARTRRENNFNVSGTKFDPRRASAAIARYNERQLRAQQARLSSFLSRGTQFYGDNSGRRMDSAKWKEYKRLEAAHNRSVQDFYKPFSRLKINSVGQTVQERLDTIYVGAQTMGGAVNIPYKGSVLTPKGVASEKALQTLIEHKRSQLAVDHWDRQILEGRDQLNQMLSAIGDDALAKRFNDLNDRQFAAVWFYSTAASQLSLNYHLIQGRMSDKTRVALEGIVSEAVKELDSLLRRASRWKI